MRGPIKWKWPAWPRRQETQKEANEYKNNSRTSRLYILLQKVFNSWSLMMVIQFAEVHGTKLHSSNREFSCHLLVRCNKLHTRRGLELCLMEHSCSALRITSLVIAAYTMCNSWLILRCYTGLTTKPRDHACYHVCIRAEQCKWLIYVHKYIHRVCCRGENQRTPDLYVRICHGIEISSDLSSGENKAWKLQWRLCHVNASSERFTKFCIRFTESRALSPKGSASERVTSGLFGLQTFSKFRSARTCQRMRNENWTWP